MVRGFSCEKFCPHPLKIEKNSLPLGGGGGGGVLGKFKKNEAEKSPGFVKNSKSYMLRYT